MPRGPQPFPDEDRKAIAGCLIVVALVAFVVRAKLNGWH